MILMFCVYENPKDYPGAFVVRRWHVGLLGAGRVSCDAVPLLVCDTLDEARGVIPEVLTRIAPVDDDDPCIVETWL